MPSLPAPEPSPCNPLPGPLPLPMPDSAAAAAESAFCRAARRHGESASAGRVRQSSFRSRLAGDDDPGAGSVSSGVTRWSYGRTQVERTAGAGSLVASSAAREGFAAAQARRRRYDVGGAEERTVRIDRSGRRRFLEAVAVDAGGRWHNLGRKRGSARSCERPSAGRGGWRRHGLRAQVAGGGASPAIEIAADLRWRRRDDGGRGQRQLG